MKTPLITIAVCCVMTLTACMSAPEAPRDPSTPQATLEDFQMIEGAWTGTLTYLDYGSKQRVSIPAAATIELVTGSTINYSISYPEEPWEDTKAEFRLSKDRTLIDGQEIKTKTSNDDGTTVYTTEYLGEDDGEPVTFRMTYQLGPNRFAIIKDIRSPDATEFVNRNEYRFSR